VTVDDTDPQGEDEIAERFDGTDTVGRCGYVTIVGAPNAGKSTLLNALVGTKVSIVSPKVQTTRTRVLGIVIDGSSQIIFCDTPGIFAPKKRLERAMVNAAWEGADDADVIMVLVDAAKKRVDEDSLAIIDRLKESQRPAILVLNKIDQIKPERLLEISAELNERGTFTDTFMISALKSKGVSDLVKALSGRMPAGPWLFPEDQISDMPMRLLAAEVTREKLFRKLHQELPYALTVETESWEEKKDGSVRISQIIYVARENQKGIVLGAGGKLAKSVGTESRRELKEMLERDVHLFLHVKVREKWSDDPERFRQMGLEFSE